VRRSRWANTAGQASTGAHLILAAFALIVALLGPTAVQADEPASSTPATIDRIQIGFAGHYKVGFWTPIEILLTGKSNITADLEIIVPDGDGVPTSTIVHAVRLEPDKPVDVRSYVKFGRPAATVSIAVHAEQNAADKIERTFSGDDVPPALAATQRLILELAEPLEFGSVARFNEEGQPEQTTIAVVTDPASLPDRALGYDGVDVAVLTTAEPAFYQHVPAASLAALQRWVQVGGGRLLLSVGGHGAELLSPGEPLEPFAPGRFEKTTPLERFAALENFAGVSQRVAEGAAGARRPSALVAQLNQVRGQIEAFEGSGAELLPLVVRTADGFGELVFVGVDLKAPPLDHWAALPQLLAALLGRNLTSGQSPPIQTSATHLGYNDLSGQLRSALDQFPGVHLTPFSLIAVLAGGYILLLFPLDYWARRRRKQSAAAEHHGRGAALAGSPVWPWIRFAVVVVGMSAGVWLLWRNSRGDRVELNQAEVVDFDLQSGLMRGDTWFSLFSPANEEHLISLQPRLLGKHAGESETELSWLGLPGTGLGGMGDGGLAAGQAAGINPGAATAELSLFTRPYPIALPRNGPASGDGEPDENASIGPVPLAACSSRCFTGRWTSGHARLIDADVLEQPDHQLTGNIRVSAGASHGAGRGDEFRLNDCVLFYDRGAYLIPHFSAAEPIDVDSLESQSADTYFTRRKIVGEKDQTGPYDRTGQDRARILEIMMFYRAAGGLQYVGLLNRYQHFLDLSGQLVLGRAILIGIGPPASELAIDGHPILAAASAPHLAIYRFLIPVRAVQSTGRPIVPTSRQLQP
jgi:hypothetical protein